MVPSCSAFRHSCFKGKSYFWRNLSWKQQFSPFFSTCMGKRINVQKERIPFIPFIVWKITLMEYFRGQKLFVFFSLQYEKGKAEGWDITLLFHLCMHICKYMCVNTYIFYVLQLSVEKAHSSFSFDRKIKYQHAIFTKDL